MDLTELRREIDVVDHELIELLERRMDLAEAVAAYKRENGLPILDAGREEEKLGAVRAVCRPETAGGIADIFAAVMAASRAYQAACMETAHGG